MDQLSIDYAQEALREFGIYAERIDKATERQPLHSVKTGDLLKLVIYADGSGHIARALHQDISFSGLDVLAKILQKKNGTKEK
jgi:hypothetical protein